MKYFYFSISKFSPQTIQRGAEGERIVERGEGGEVGRPRQAVEAIEAAQAGEGK